MELDHFLSGLCSESFNGVQEPLLEAQVTVTSWDKAEESEGQTSWAGRQKVGRRASDSVYLGF